MTKYKSRATIEEIIRHDNSTSFQLGTTTKTHPGMDGGNMNTESRLGIKKVLITALKMNSMP